MGWLLFLGTIGAPLVVIFAVSFALTYDGVRIKGLPRRGHHISTRRRHVVVAQAQERERQEQRKAAKRQRPAAREPRAEK